MSTFVLIHGAGDVGWYWHLVAAELRRRGHDPVAPDLPCDDDSAGLSEYADAVVEAIGERTDVVVVAQSLGCFTAPLVCDRVPVKLLVLVAPMIPAPGEAPADYWANTRYGEEAQERYEDDIALFYQDVPRELATEALERSRRQAGDRLGEPSPLTGWPDVPTRVLLCRDDRLLPATFVRRVARERLGITPDEIDGGHTPALSRPKELAVRLEAYAAEVSASSVRALRSGLFLPPFDALADPRVVAHLAAEAEEAGWDGVFVWDHVRWREPVTDLADAWITLAAIATATRAVRLGPMVTPLARRRPVKVARETATLDRLSDGRLTLGVGLGSDLSGSELSITGEELDDRRRAGMLDESLEILTAAWTGEPVHHRGEHYTVDGMRFLPTPVQRPGVPVWVGGYPGKAGPLRRAARYQGFFPVDLESPDQLADVVSALAGLRREFGTDVVEPYDIVAALPPDTDPAPYASAGATWWLVEFPWDGVSVDQVRSVIRDGQRPASA